MGGAGDELAPDAFWARVRERYEEARENLSVVARDAGLSRHALTNRARNEGWRLRNAPRQKLGGTRETLARFKALLQQRLTEFEAQIGSLSAEANAATSERDIRAMNTLVRTLEKVLELERKERARRTARRKQERRFDDAEREALAEKLKGLQRELVAGRSRPAADDAPDPAGEDAEPRLPDVGPRRETASA